ncbi:hypothetical protein C8Q72DRAFT_487043 [Fomitopsis betulina]|nr:hypothetical protein C8Q72DRAFT_487043 [Fomitopsis betulina]
MTANLLALNEDVLITLVSYLDPPTARLLSYTARRIHHIAKHRALQSVTLHTIKTTTTYCAYMLQAMPHRISALHELRIHCLVLSAYEQGTHTTDDTEESYTKAAVLLTDLLRHALGLRVLVMASAQAWMAYEPQMVDALASIDTLQEIELELVGSHTSDFINKMRSTPRKLTFRRTKRARGRLELDPQLRLPSVESLQVYDPDNLPEPPTLAQAFPRTRRLDLRRTRSFRGFQPHPSDTFDTATWSALERVRGSVHSFVQWKNISPVHLLELVGPLSSVVPPPSWRERALAGIRRGEVAYSAAAPIVDNFQPVALILELDTKAGPDHLNELIGASKRLRYLAVAIHDKDRQASFETWWTAFCAAIAESNILCLELRVTWDAQTDAASTCTDDSYREELLRTLEASAPSYPSALRYISLDCSPAGDSPWRYDFLASERRQEITTPPELRWWGFSGVRPLRLATALEPTKGEKIAAYLRSAKYSWSVPFEEGDVAGL